ncbi:hypothetical protein BGW38_004051, partial [Lunasporangiospora selenospora]
MLNRKLPPPKPKPTQRTIPAGFVAQTSETASLPGSASAPTATSSTITTGAATTATTSVITATKVTYSALPTAVPQAPPKAPNAVTVDENSWLKARTAQVQRQENDPM